MSPSRTRTPGRPPRRRSARFIETRAALLFISPWIIGFVVFTAWPVINSAYLSLTDYDVINDPNYVGFDNYVQLFEDPKVGLALWNTFVFAVLSVPTHLVVALGLALLLNSASKATGFFRTAFFLPKMTPPVAIGILLLLLFNGQDGLINAFLGVFGIDGPAWTTDPNWVKPALVLMNLWTVGSSVVIILAALRGVPQELYDSALVDGAGWWKRLLRITVPMISPTLFFLFIVDSINALQSFTEAYTAFFGAGNTTYSNDAALFYAIYLFQQAFEFLHMGYASALAWLLFIVIMAITAVQIVVTRRYVHYEGGNP